MIATNPRVQKKLFDEIRSVFGDDPTAPVTYKQLKELNYMTVVIKEALRLYPPVTGIGRTIDKDIHLGQACNNDREDSPMFLFFQLVFLFADDKRIIPKGTIVDISLVLMFRDEKYFPQPNDFIPERFYEMKNINTFAYVPFSAGNRNCIGQKFAMLEIKTTVSTLLRHFELVDANEEVETVYEMLMRPKNGIKVLLKKRVH